MTDNYIVINEKNGDSFEVKRVGRQTSCLLAEYYAQNTHAWSHDPEPLTIWPVFMVRNGIGTVVTFSRKSYQDAIIVAHEQAKCYAQDLIKGHSSWGVEDQTHFSRESPLSASTQSP